MTRLVPLALAAMMMPAMLGLAACGSSDAPAGTTAADGGGPSGVPASAGRINPAAEATVADYPPTPVCNPGGLRDEDEEICQHFWNHLLAWDALPATAQGAQAGPTLSGAGAGSMVYESYEKMFNDPHWWGPNGLVNAKGTCDSGRDQTRCYGSWLEFGKTTNIETFDNGGETAARTTWRLAPGDVSFGREYFYASNDGGKGGNQSAFCAGRSGKGGSGEWVSCSNANAERDGAVINTDQPPGNDEDYASFGWVIEDYPVLVGIGNQLAGSKLEIDQFPTGDNVQFSKRASSAGMLAGTASIEGTAGAKGLPQLWLAGYRTRTGEGAVSIAGTLRPAKDDFADNAWNGAEVTITAKFAKDVRTCEVRNTGKAGDQAKCDIREFTAGSPSRPGVLLVTIQRGSGSSS